MFNSVLCMSLSNRLVRNFPRKLPYSIFTGIQKSHIKKLTEIDRNLNLLNNHSALKTGHNSIFPSPRLLVGLLQIIPTQHIAFDLCKDFQFFVAGLNARMKAWMKCCLMTKMKFILNKILKRFLSKNNQV